MAYSHMAHPQVRKLLWVSNVFANEPIGNIILLWPSKDVLGVNLEP